MTSDYDPQRPWYGQISISPELTQSPTPQMLTAAARLAPRGVYVAGNTTSSSGLTVTVVKDASGDFACECSPRRPRASPQVTVVKDASGDFALEAGALVMGDQVRSPSDCMLIALEAGTRAGDGRSGEMALGLMGDQVRWPSDCTWMASVNVPLSASLMTSQCLSNDSNDLNDPDYPS